MRRAAVKILALLLGSFLFASAFAQRAAEGSSNSSTNDLQTLRAYLQVQEQLHQNAQALEATRRQVEEDAVRNAKAIGDGMDVLSGKLKAIEEGLARQRAEELRTLQSSYHTVLFFVGAFALLAILGMVAMAYLQWKAVNRLTHLPANLGAARAPDLIASGDSSDSHTVVEVNARLMSALEQLEKRLIGLEENGRIRLQLPGHPAHEQGGNSNGGSVQGGAQASGGLLEQGRELLQSDRAEEALAAFENALKADPDNPDVWIRKGTALEKLGSLEQALSSMDKALELDPDLTLALLLKGGILNRMGKFAEALECFEKAARTHDSHVA